MVIDVEIVDRCIAHTTKALLYPKYYKPKHLYDQLYYSYKIQIARLQIFAEN